MASSKLKKVNLKYINDKEFNDLGVGCIVLSKSKELVLQLRTQDAPTSPGYIATFGGGIEHGETPIQALVRELDEELGAKVSAQDAVFLDAFTNLEESTRNLNYIYFWHDVDDTITGCYEGSAEYLNDPALLSRYSKVTNIVTWGIKACQKRGLLK